MKAKRRQRERAAKKVVMALADDLGDLGLEGLESILIPGAASRHGLANPNIDPTRAGGVVDLEADANEVYNVIDIDGDGEITRDELSAHLLSCGYTPAAVDAVFGALDTNADAAISRVEFATAFIKVVMDDGGRVLSHKEPFARRVHHRLHQRRGGRRRTSRCVARGTFPFPSQRTASPTHSPRAFAFSSSSRRCASRRASARTTASSSLRSKRTPTRSSRRPV